MPECPPPPPFITEWLPPTLPLTPPTPLPFPTPPTPLPLELELSDTTPITDDDEDEELPDEDETPDPEPTILPTGFIADSGNTFENVVANTSNVNKLVIVRVGNNFVRRAGLKDIRFMAA